MTVSRLKLPTKQLTSTGLGCFQKCVITELKGKSAGVAILWEKHISVHQVGHLYHDARTTSLQIEVPVVGRMNLVCIYGWDSQVSLNLDRTRELCQKLQSQGVPFAILGDHNMEPHECGPMLEGLASKVVIKHAGVSCVTQAKLSILDYAIVSHHIAKVDLEMRTISSILATHRPFQLFIMGETNTQHLKTFRPNRVASFKLVKGPQLESQWQQWGGNGPA